MDGIEWTRRVAFFVFLLTVALTAGAGDADQEAWAKAVAPGAPHEDLAKQAGEWSYVVTIWEKPGAEPYSLEGTATKTMIMGGRFLKEVLHGEFDGGSFEGFGVTGYDNVAGEYVSIWFDNAGTGIHQYTGQTDARGVKTYHSSFRDPSTGREISTRSVGQVTDRDNHSFESFMMLPDGSEHLQMRVEYKRAG